MGKTYGTPGPRGIYPELCDSRTLSRCSIMANALWPRLIVQADDQGRLHGDAQDIRGLCFPKMPKVSTRAVQKALDELAEVGSLLVYTAKSEPYIQITDWWEYQSFARRAYPSRYPSPTGWDDVIYGIDGSPATYSKAREHETRRTAAKRGETPPTQAEPSLANPSLVEPIQAESSPPRRAASRRPNGKAKEPTEFDQSMAAAAIDGFVADIAAKKTMA